jgi:poly-beta-hydroxybutyrate-responsive repressor
MSTKKTSPKKSRRPGSGKQERYIQPSILMGLYSKPSYGYELIQNIQRFGFVEGHAPPGMIYRHLRQMEEEGLVSSQWDTDGTGPAKRMYRITTDGGEVLAGWVDYMERQANDLIEFIKVYRAVKAIEKNEK